MRADSLPERAELEVADPASADARFCLDQYFAELDARFSAGFDPALSMTADERELREPEGLLLIARADGRPVGCGALKLRPGRPAELKRMWVDASCRGTGLGRRLLLELERAAARGRVEVVELETNGSLTEAVALYRSAGYEEVEPFNDEPHAHHWFQKRLPWARLRDLADDYRAESATEHADVERLRQTAEFGDPWDRRASIHATASALVVHPASQRVLLRWHERQQAWLQVGGHGDPGESDPVAIAMREGAEETGLTDLAEWTTDRSPLHVVVVPVAAKGEEPAHEHIDIRYLFTTESPDSVRPESETAPLRWLSFEQARAETREESLRESILRAQARLSDGRGRPG